MTAASSNSAAGRVGSSSTRPSLQPETHRVTEAGVDTWRLLFRTTLDSPPDHPLFDVGRYKAQWFAGHSVLALEGHPSREGLVEPWALEDAYQDVVEDLREWGHVPTAFAGVARLDSTVTQRMSRHEGQAVLAGLAALDVPRAIQSFAASRRTPSHTSIPEAGEYSDVPTTRVESRVQPRRRS